VEAYDRSGKTRLAGGVLASATTRSDTATAPVRLPAQFENGDSSLFPNQFVNVRMLVDAKHDAVMCRGAAIQRGPARTFVYVVKPTTR